MSRVRTLRKVRNFLPGTISQGRERNICKLLSLDTGKDVSKWPGLYFAMQRELMQGNYVLFSLLVTALY